MGILYIHEFNGAINLMVIYASSFTFNDHRFNLALSCMLDFDVHILMVLI